MSYKCEQCQGEVFDVDYERQVTCTNCFHSIIWMRAIEAVFESIGLMIHRDGANSYEVISNTDPHQKIANIKFLTGKNSAIIVESFSYDHIAVIVEALELFSTGFTQTRICLAYPDKKGEKCPLCSSKVDSTISCTKKGHFYNLSSTTLLQCIILQLAEGKYSNILVSEPSYYKVVVKIGEDTINFEFRNHGEESVLAISQLALKYFPKIVSGLKMFEIKNSTRKQRLVVVDM